MSGMKVMAAKVIGGGDLVDAEALAAALRPKIQGEVRFDRGSRALYATDASNYRQVPIGVVIPRTKTDILQTIATCREFGAPILSRGGGTSLAGQCCNVAVVMDMSKYYNQILKLDKEARTARIQPGIVLDRLRKMAEQEGLTFGPDPATHSHCTLGGMMGNNSCGVHALMAGKTVDNIISLEIATYDGLHIEVGATSEGELEQLIREGGRKGEIYANLKSIRDRFADQIRQRYPRIPRRVSGYNLDELLPENGFQVARALIGTESTCVTILEATVRLVHNPPARSLLVLGYPDTYESADHVPEILEFKPIGLEGVDHVLVEKMKRKKPHSKVDLLPGGSGWLLVEFGAELKEEADAQAKALMARLKLGPNAPTMKLFDNEADEKEIWNIRESGLASTAFIPGDRDTWEGWDDSAVDPNKLGGYLRELRTLYNKYNYHGALYGHFGQGCIHSRIDFDLVTDQGLKDYRAFVDEAADLCVRYGGSLSGEHGDGQARAELLPKMFGNELVGAFVEFKTIWDPLNKMNPGKVVNAYKILDNLRLGTTYDPPNPKTHFALPADRGTFARAALRCVGVGKCRREESGVMCPSYRVTREEMHSTRGRSHLLFEMLQGDVIKDGWKSEEVKEAMDLCLACKGCKSDCPVNVDLATYKAEFLSHYYEGRLRPRSAYAFGLVYWWLRAASLMPRVVNFFTHTPGLSALSKKLAGMSPERTIPFMADETFKEWYAKREPSPPRGVGGNEGSSKSSVILWPDTFNNHFHPETAIAATEVLESLGFSVQLPQTSLCCGRPLYDYGILDLAKRQLLQILDVLRPQIRAGVPVIGLEPSCVAVFRDELVNMLPNDQDAKRLSEQTYMFSEFLMKKVPDFEPPQLKGKAIVQGHCHDKSVMGYEAEKKLLEKMGLDVSYPEAGCCGMAGSFGFEEDHFDISMKIGEQALLPAARQAEPGTLFIADGFSCREQIAQGAGRRAHHIAEVIAMALKHPLPSGERAG